MKNLRELFTHERAARPLLIAHVQSSLGSGAAYVALLLIAYERFHSALAVSAILLCEFVPMLLLGAVMGAAATVRRGRSCSAPPSSSASSAP